MGRKSEIVQRIKMQSWCTGYEFPASRAEWFVENLVFLSSDLSKNSNMTQLSSQSEEGNLIRHGISFESLHETTPNGSLKRFKSNREDSNLRAASSLESLHGKAKSEASDDGMYARNINWGNICARMSLVLLVSKIFLFLYT